MPTSVEVVYPESAATETLANLLAGMRQHQRRRDPGRVAERIEALQQLSDDLLQQPDAGGGIPGLAFLAAFLRAANLQQLLARELPQPEALDRFVHVGARKSLRLQPRGLAVHWVAGNVPLLGMFSWVVSALAGNSNVVRLSGRQADVMSPILDRLNVQSPAGRALAESTAVVRFPRDDLDAQRTMSQLADVRIAWGGEEAVQTVRGLPARWDVEDIILGPRVSYAVVDPAAAGGRDISRLVTDIVFFDQLACSSPQRLYVRGQIGEPRFEQFLRDLAGEFARQTRRYPRHPLDHAETYQITLDRTRVLLAGGRVDRDRGTQWTLATVAEPLSGVVCANRFLQIVPFQEVATTITALPHNIQTIVTLLPQNDMQEFTEAASRLGVCRFPRPGEGNHFEDPWDGIALLSRLVRWTLRSESARTQPERSTV